MKEYQVVAQKIIGFIKSKLMYLLALIIIVSGSYELYAIAVTDAFSEMAYIDRIFSASVKIIMGLFILFDPNKTLTRAIGFYAMSLGISRIITSFNSLSSTQLVSFIIGLVMIGMGINLLVSGYNYLNDKARGRFGMTVSSSIMSIVLIYSIFLSTNMGLAGNLGKLDDVASDIIAVIQYLILLVIMDTEEVRFSSVKERAVAKLRSISVTRTLESGFTLQRKDAITLVHMFEDRSGWSAVTDGGPVDCEKRINFVKARIAGVMILQKWKDSDRIYATVVNDDKGTILQANRFSITDVVPDVYNDTDFTNIRLFSDGRMLSSISVRENDLEEEEEVISDVEVEI